MNEKLKYTGQSIKGKNGKPVAYIYEVERMNPREEILQGKGYRPFSLPKFKGLK